MRRQAVVDACIPLVVLARTREDGLAYAAAQPTQAAVTCVVTDNAEPLHKMPLKSFAYTFVSAPTLAVWAAAVERGIPLRELT